MAWTKYFLYSASCVLSLYVNLYVYMFMVLCLKFSIFFYDWLNVYLIITDTRGFLQFYLGFDHLVGVLCLLSLWILIKHCLILLFLLAMIRWSLWESTLGRDI